MDYCAAVPLVAAGKGEPDNSFRENTCSGLRARQLRPLSRTCQASLALDRLGLVCCHLRFIAPSEGWHGRSVRNAPYQRCRGSSLRRAATSG
eukprot:scaffold624_cov402-Prasinococcus_capsulatus_cf.AAC.44